MTEADVESAARQETIPLDPFSFHDGVASRITGLGGIMAGSDPAYAFHTPYVEAASGPAQFVVRFTGLRAKRGTLLLRVNMLPLEPGAHARLANSDRIQLNRLLQMHGEATIRFEAFRGYSFALFGLIQDDTDAAADGLEILLQRAADQDGDGIEIDARTSAYGRDTARPTTHLISTGHATLADPVSQLRTAPQLREPAYAELLTRIGADESMPGEFWPEIYVLQVLRRYGLLADGANGLCVAPFGSRLAAAIADAGPRVTAAWTEDEGDIQGAPAHDRIVAQPIPAGAIPRRLVNYDFICSTRIADFAGSAVAAAGLIEEAMNRLRPGGLAVFTMPFALGVAASHAPDTIVTAFTRFELERLALVLISRNHEVAQIKIDDAGAGDVVGGDEGAVGIIARRAPSVL